jgi:hypothetical protein
VAGAIPSAYVEMRTQRTTTSGTLVDIPGVSTTITLETTAHIRVELNIECSLYSNPASTLGLAISINGTDHDESGIHLSGVNDPGVASIGHRTETPLAAGTYTIKGRMRRESGSGTVAVDSADLFVFALQGAKGDPGPAGADGASGDARTTAMGTATFLSGTLTLDCLDGFNFAHTLTANVTAVALDNVPAAPARVPFSIQFTQDATGGRTVNGWASCFQWSGGARPAITVYPNASDLIEGQTINGGTTAPIARTIIDAGGGISGTAAEGQKILVRGQGIAGVQTATDYYGRTLSINTLEIEPAGGPFGRGCLRSRASPVAKYAIFNASSDMNAAGDFSLACWVKAASIAGVQNILGAESAGNLLCFYHGGTDVYAYHAGVARVTFSGGAAWLAAGWCWLAWTRSGTTMTAVIFDSTGTRHAGSWTNSPATLITAAPWIGSAGSSYPCDGSFADFLWAPGSVIDTSSRPASLWPV